jgi:uncharacterized coiled-coil protein SlyX
MSGNDILMRAVNERLSALERLVTVQGTLIDAQSSALASLVDPLQKIQPQFDDHAQRIAKLAVIIIQVGAALTESKALPPQWAIAIRNVMRESLEPDESEGTRLLVKLLDHWVNHPSVSGSQAASDEKPRLTLVAGNDGGTDKTVSRLA